MRGISINRHAPKNRRREFAVLEQKHDSYRARCQIFRERGTGNIPTIVLGCFVPDATETVEFQHRLLRRHGSIYYLNYSRNGFCLEMFTAQLADLIDDLAHKGQKPLLLGVSFGCGLLSNFLQHAGVHLHESIRGLILMSPVLTTDDLIRSADQKRDGVRMLESNLKKIVAADPANEAGISKHIERSRRCFQALFNTGAENRTLGVRHLANRKKINDVIEYTYRDQPATSRGRSAPDLDNMTWPGIIKMFCETSGTTAPTKFIPFSDQMFSENRRAALDMMSCYLAANPQSRILSDKVLYMSGSTTLTKVKRGVWSGDMSALTLRFRPWYLTSLVEPKAEISALPWEEKLQSMAELLLCDDRIRVISGVPPWIILLLKRCREIGCRPLRDLLPNLELIIHGGTSLKPYRNAFEDLFDGHLPICWSCSHLRKPSWLSSSTARRRCV